MIDVFVIAVLSALVRMGGFKWYLSGDRYINVCFSRHNDNVFCYDVYDPRLSWDRQPESERDGSPDGVQSD